MYLCATDAEAFGRLRAGHLVAWAEPTDAELGTVYAEVASGFPYQLAWGPGTSDQEDVRRLQARGRELGGGDPGRQAWADSPGSVARIRRQRSKFDWVR